MGTFAFGDLSYLIGHRAGQEIDGQIQRLLVDVLGSVNYSLWAKCSVLSVEHSQIYLFTYCLWLFCATMTKLSKCNGNYMTWKTWSIYYLDLYRSLLTSNPNNQKRSKTVRRRLMSGYIIEKQNPFSQTLAWFKLSYWLKKKKRMYPTEEMYKKTHVQKQSFPIAPLLLR